MSDPQVDVTIAVHSATRPIARAVGSVVDQTKSPVRVNVVAHNIDPELIRSNLGPYASHPSVRLLPFSDGIPSPAGPMNHGLSLSTAPFVCVIGSDDELSPGALDSWLALQRNSGASMVIAKIRIGTRGPDPYPPVRWGSRRSKLDGDRDRLAYRSAPLGLICRKHFGDLRFTEGLASGEDLAYSGAIWFSGESIAYDLHGPAYLVHESADDRVTSAPRSVAEDFAFLSAIQSSAWFSRLAPAERTALTVKILRVHFFDAVLARLGSTDGFEAHRDGLRSVARQLSHWSPQAVGLLSRADRAVVDELQSESPDLARMRRLISERWNYRTPAALLPRNPLLVWHRQAPFRTLFAGFRAAKNPRR